MSSCQTTTQTRVIESTLLLCCEQLSDDDDDEIKNVDSYDSFSPLDFSPHEVRHNEWVPMQLLSEPASSIRSMFTQNHLMYCDRKALIEKRLGALALYLAEKYKSSLLNHQISKKEDIFEGILRCLDMNIDMDIIISMLLEGVETFADLCIFRSDMTYWSRQPYVPFEEPGLSTQRQLVAESVLYLTEHIRGYQEALNSWAEATEIPPGYKTAELRKNFKRFIRLFIEYRFLQRQARQARSNPNHRA